MSTPRPDTCPNQECVLVQRHKVAKEYQNEYLLMSSPLMVSVKASLPKTIKTSYNSLGWCVNWVLILTKKSSTMWTEKTRTNVIL
jgi:hypothetical protein